MTIIDGDTVDLTNKNRQMPALDSTVGLPKVNVVAQRLLDINPLLDLKSFDSFLVRKGFATSGLRTLPSFFM